MYSLKKSAERKCRNFHFISIVSNTSLVEYQCLPWEAVVRRRSSKQVLLILRHVKTPVLKSLFNKLYQKETPAQVFSCEYCEIFKKSFFHKTPRWLLLAFTTAFRNYYWGELSVIFFTLTHPGKRLRSSRSQKRCS